MESTSEALPPLDDNTVRLAHQVQAFLRSGHSYANRIDDETRSLSLGISEHYPRLPDLEVTTLQGQRGGIASDDSRLIDFPSPWALSRSDLRDDIRWFTQRAQPFRNSLVYEHSIRRETTPMSSGQGRGSSTSNLDGEVDGRDTR